MALVKGNPAGQKPVILQIVGYQNSGKTTMMLQLIKQLVANNIKVVTVKHHGHGGKPTLPEKDSTKHSDAGSLATVVEGANSLLLHAEHQDWPLQKQLQLLSFFDPEVILIEGHKYENFPKIVIIRNKNDEHLLTDLTNIVAVIYWEENYKHKLSIPNFAIENNESVTWVTDYVLQRVKN